MIHPEIEKKYKNKLTYLKSKKSKCETQLRNLRLSVNKRWDAIEILIDLKDKLKIIESDMTESTKVIRKYNDLVRDEKLLISKMQEKITSIRKEIGQSNTKINKLNKERLVELGEVKKKAIIEEHGFDLKQGEVYTVDFNKVPKKDLIHSKTKLKLGSYITSESFSMKIVGETNLRYKLELDSESLGHNNGFANTAWGGTRYNKKVGIQVTKDKLMEFLNKYSQAMKRKKNLKELLDG